MAQPAYQNSEKLVGTFRRFQYGPVYQVVAVRMEGAKALVDIELPESGEKATLPLDQVLANPAAE
ncbi:MAG TPA: DUF5397 family protein [Kofleriaceae bacterium]|jgi:hypothetical protein